MVYGDVTTVVYIVSFVGHTEVLEGFQVSNTFSNSSEKNSSVLCRYAHVYVKASGIWRSLPFPTERACTFSELGLGWEPGHSLPVSSDVSRLKGEVHFVCCGDPAGLGDLGATILISGRARPPTLFFFSRGLWISTVSELVDWVFTNTDELCLAAHAFSCVLCLPAFQMSW